jgi:DNA-binding beta-propeller fold protein YncE
MTGCSESGYSMKAAYDEATYGDTGYYSPQEASDYDDGYGSEAEEPSDTNYDDGYGSEAEGDFLSLRPATTNTYVFVANPDRNTVTRISVPSLEVMTVEVGVEPSLVETSADYTRAVTFNKGSNDISIIDAETLDVTEVTIRDNLNQMRMSPDGNWVICYHDVGADNGGSVNGGAVTFNAISIINLQTQEHFEAIVGSYPHDVQFTEDSSLAVVISDDYMASIDLTTNSITPKRIAIADDLINPPRAEEVLLDPNGKYALIRQYAVSDLVLVDLEATENQVSSVPCGDNPTDMDVSEDGSQVYVVARGASPATDCGEVLEEDPTACDQQGELWTYDVSDIDDIITDSISFPTGEIFGQLQLSPDDESGLFYSTQSGQSRMGVWDRNSDEIVVKGLVKPVSKVGLSPTGETTVVFHSKSNGDTPSTSQFFGSHALSLIDMYDLFSTAYKLVAEPTSFTSTPDGDIGFFIMEGQPYLEMLNYRTLVPSEVRLPSVPVHLGSLPDTNIAFVSQEHNLGRISFFDTDEGDLQTITGFELNSAIDHAE